MIRSNRSPLTGAYRSPSRRSTLDRVDHAVSPASAIARGLMSVATTCSAWPARCRLCTPQPVPRSSALSDRAGEWSAGPGSPTRPIRRARSPAASGARRCPGWVSGPRPPRSRRRRWRTAGCRSRRGSRRRVARIPASTSGADQSGQRVVQRRPGHRLLQRPQPGQGGQRIVPAGQRPDAGDRAVPPQCPVRLRPDRLDDCVDVIVRRRERRRQSRTAESLSTRSAPSPRACDHGLDRLRSQIAAPERA